MPEQKPAVPAANEEPKKEENLEPVIEQDPVDEKSPYRAEFEKIEGEKKALEAKHASEMEAADVERKRQVDIKDKALEKAKKDSEPFKQELKREMKGELQRELDLRDARGRLRELTSDPTAQKVILHHFENLPDSLRTDDMEENLLTAMAIANRKRLPELLNQNQVEAESERASIASMGGANLPGRSSFQKAPSPVARTAGQLLKAYAGKNPDLAKKLAERVNKTR